MYLGAAIAACIAYIVIYAWYIYKNSADKKDASFFEKYGAVLLGIAGIASGVMTYFLYSSLMSSVGMLGQAGAQGATAMAVQQAMGPAMQHINGQLRGMEQRINSNIQRSVQQAVAPAMQQAMSAQRQMQQPQRY